MKSILDFITIFKDIETYKGPGPRTMANGGIIPPEKPKLPQLELFVDKLKTYLNAGAIKKDYATQLLKDKMEELGVSDAELGTITGRRGEADGGRIGLSDGQLVRNTVDGSRPGYDGRKDRGRDIHQEKKYKKAILSYENELHLTPSQYTDQRPRFDYVYQSIDISGETLSKDIHQIQADLTRIQFLHGYKYYRRRIDNYKNYLITLRELYKYKVIVNKENQIENFSNFPQMYQNIKLFHDSMDDAGKMNVKRDMLGKVLYINWQVVGERDKIRRREFEYFDDGLLSKLID